MSALSERLQAVIKSIYDIQTAESNIKFVEKNDFLFFHVHHSYVIKAVNIGCEVATDLYT